MPPRRCGQRPEVKPELPIGSPQDVKVLGRRCAERKVVGGLQVNLCLALTAVLVDDEPPHA